MATDSLDLVKLFSTVATTMADNKDLINEADTRNNDHGDDMAAIFEVISEAMEEKSGADAADQLEYASQLLRSRSSSGSADMYARGLMQAAQEFQGGSLTANDSTKLVSMLLGGGNAPAAQSSDDLLGSLLSSVDTEDLLTAGLSFMQSKQEGDDNMQAVVEALVSSSEAGQTQHRAQSGGLMANALLQVVSSLTQGK